jgi:hypothetical protein
MPFFDSPFERCSVCNSYVVLDQTQRECAEEHQCVSERCPLMSFFTEGQARRAQPEELSNELRSAGAPTATQEPRERSSR